MTTDTIKLLYGQDTTVFNNGAVIIFTDKILKIIGKSFEYTIKDVEQLHNVEEKFRYIDLIYMKKQGYEYKVINIDTGESIDSECDIWEEALLTRYSGYERGCIDILDSSFDTVFRVRRKDYFELMSDIAVDCAHKNEGNYYDVTLVIQTNYGNAVLEEDVRIKINEDINSITLEISNDNWEAL